MTTSKKEHTTILPQDFEALIELERQLADLSVAAKRLADASGLSRRELARKMGNASPSNLQRILSGEAYNSTLETLARFAWACDQRLQVSFVPRQQTSHPRFVPSHECNDNVVNLLEYAKHHSKDRGIVWGAAEADEAVNG